MASLRDLRRRIKATKNMQQITKAMKAVAAAKMRKAQEAVTYARPYSKRIQGVLGRVAIASGGVNHPLLAVHEPKKAAFIVMTSDRGLCGGFNSNLIRRATQEIKAVKGEYELIAVGRKGCDFFRHRGLNVAKEYIGLGGNVKYSTARDIATFVIDKYSVEEYDEVYLIYSQFVNVLVQKPVMVKILPAEPPTEGAGAEGEKDGGKMPYIFEPSAEAVLTELLPKYIENAIYQGLLEINAGFYSAQMTAMENATKNASDMIDRLTLTMNRARQAQITKEISEIVGGAAALE
ncbi:MAG: ATP synthase F1 subunit gamma [Desulfotomaculaceae bacterium]|nr:F0F1 ATP synthase subunit gamma [Bacillota bacterium]MDD4335603.1 ATP synthase F1 subunit gamma [Desulfotomaculaceae bacterium]OQA08988.1 MAG: ATP synthase gamma chain [Firmicutes bacterium ADurb.Bin373]